jgi:hypothetical protein
MMPPKKSKAARAATEDQDGGVSNAGEVEKPSSDDKPKPAIPEPDIEEDEEDIPEVNIFKMELVFGKRNRANPQGQHKLQDWFVH